jgi:hypothetical protein
MGPGAVADEIYGEKRRLSPMIMQIAKRTVYYPVSKKRRAISSAEVEQFDVFASLSY